MLIHMIREVLREVLEATVQHDQYSQGWRDAAAATVGLYDAIWQAQRLVTSPP